MKLSEFIAELLKVGHPEDRVVLEVRGIERLDVSDIRVREAISESRTNHQVVIYGE